MAWVARNNYLTVSETNGNAKEVYDYFGTKGFSLNAICAMLGNMYRESQINPAAWQNYVVNYNKGYGIVQWTPATNFTTWAVNNGYNIQSGFAQCQRIIWELQNHQQYYATANYPESFSQFSISTKNVDYLTRAFFYNYERGSIQYAEMPTRIKWANYYYEYFSGETPEPPEPEPPIFHNRNRRQRLLIMTKRRCLKNGSIKN